MQCRTCGANLPPQASVCPNCGNAVPYNMSPSNSGPYEPTVQATPYQSPQTPPTSYGAPPPPPQYGGSSNPQYPPIQTPQQYPYQAPPSPYQPGQWQQPPSGSPPNKNRTGLIVGIIIGLVVLACIGSSVLAAPTLFNSNKTNTGTTPSATSPATTVAQATATSAPTEVPTAAPTPTTAPQQGGSGAQVSPDAAAIITGTQTAKKVDTTTAGPIDPTTTFKPFETVYVTFTLDSDAHDFVQNPGFAEVKFYAGSSFIGKKNIEVNRAAPGGYFTAVYYTETPGSAELYWCTKSSCDDEKLAQIAKFTIAK